MAVANGEGGSMSAGVLSGAAMDAVSGGSGVGNRGGAFEGLFHDAGIDENRNPCDAAGLNNASRTGGDAAADLLARKTTTQISDDDSMEMRRDGSAMGGSCRKSTRRKFINSLRRLLVRSNRSLFCYATTLIALSASSVAPVARFFAMLQH